MSPRCSLVAALLLLAGCGGEPVTRTPAVGGAAPAYAAVTLDGDSISLAQLRGEVVLLNVWATWCHPCREEIPALQKLHETYSARGFQVVGVSVDAEGEEAGIREFAKGFGVTYPIWLDPEERVSSTFRLIGVPSTYLINRKGEIVWKHVGPVQATDSTLTRRLEQALAES